MSFLESPRMPDCVTFGSSFGPTFQTDIVVVHSGAESRNADWAQSLIKGEVGMRPMYQADTLELKEFFEVVGGMAIGFRIKDWSDYQANASNGKFTAIDATHFQMVKRYTKGAMSRDRNIYKPVTGTVTVTGGSGATVDYTTGIVTVTSGTPASWAGEFDIPARFLTDQCTFAVIEKNISKGLLYQWSSIPITEIRP